MPLFKNKQELGWCFYDWGNSAFATTVMAGFFPVFFKEYWSQGVAVTESTAKLGLANSISGLVVALLAPVLGAIADRGSRKKKFLMLFAYLGALSTSALFFVARGQWPQAALIYVMGTIGFSGGNIFYDALLPGIVDDKKIDFVSALGYAMGYLGGGLLFALNVWMTLSPATFGLADAGEAVRVSFITAGVWWGVFTLPIMLFVPETQSATAHSLRQAVREGGRQLAHTFRKIRHLKTIGLFLAAYWLYIDGVDTIVRMAVDYGLSIGFEAKDLIVALLITQFVGFPSAIVYGRLGERIGAKRAIYLAIVVYLLVVLWAVRMSDKIEFYALAIVIGLVQGGIQALSRSLYSRLIPHDQTAEFYGFYNLLGKFAVIFGPILIGVTGMISDSPRTGIASIAVLFVLGGLLLSFVDEKQGAAEVKHLRLTGGRPG
ncbi:MAG: MFS transporter [candidate division KSB1 bacterium]|nr:MFS transporter [candidate division KSB1 bacterium]MDZ7273833.1 MFS transporter [candidate division KSB1 bacterium]MDZ7285989.1 MFS transporter [candidate division KSB1 bacterium]MDZ7299021.1 MFS transporter [candidate division KSB1 bacterium]MDZ7309580.1 MFS transporter [candidate division KSB1 bacterium]